MNTQPRHPKCRALPVEPHPDIHFSAMIPRRGVKIKIFLSVVIPVVKAAFVPPSATGESPASAGVARLCGVSPYPVPDTATALPKQARYQLRYTRLFRYFIRLVVFSQTPGYSISDIIPWKKRKSKIFCLRPAMGSNAFLRVCLLYTGRSQKAIPMWFSFPCFLHSGQLPVPRFRR